ncbi:UPF0481 protein At3g47200-like [Ziziphus jujuba]|uniref:UPF0481 protein At3g47200-like n=1 Tax=Ziziphus jujuba TaxID=326968 RepID=A0ABM4ADG3_ZIZJJ|nr:UPF0481 protein At3g47200-like [Ziziphus jujuba]
MASVYLHDKEKQDILTEPFLDKQRTYPEGSIMERGLASDQHNINIIEIPKDLEPYPPKETCWIQRVPEKLRNIREEAYTPQLVSFGPLHYGNPKLKPMQVHKIKYEQEFWNRDFCKHIPKEERMKFMETEDWLEDFQSKYAVTFESVDRSELKRLILQDACFISELFLRNYEIQLYNEKRQSKTPENLPQEINRHSEDYILRRPWLTEAIRQDLILLENQLPYSVLTDLFDFIFNPTPVKVPEYLPELDEKSKRHDFFLKIAAEFFLKYYKFGEPPANGAAAAESTFLDIFQTKEKIDCDQFKDIPIKHFTDLVRKFMLPVDWMRTNNKDKPSDDSCVRCLYSAKQLDRAGVKCGPPGPGDKKVRLTDIKKKDGLCLGNGFCCYWINGCCLDLQIPELSVKDDTECIMRNVMALELFVYPREPFICNYVFLLDQLISTEEDVQFLIDKKFVSN